MNRVSISINSILHFTITVNRKNMLGFSFINHSVIFFSSIPYDMVMKAFYHFPFADQEHISNKSLGFLIPLYKDPPDSWGASPCFRTHPIFYHFFIIPFCYFNSTSIENLYGQILEIINRILEYWLNKCTYPDNYRRKYYILDKPHQ